MHLYDTHSSSSSSGGGGGGEDQPVGAELTRFAHAAPVLDCCFGEGDGEVFSGGLDWTVNQYHPPSPLHTRACNIAELPSVT